MANTENRTAHPDRRIAIVTPYAAEPRLDNYAEFVLAQTLIERGWIARMYSYGMRNPPSYQSDVVYKGVPVYRSRFRLGVAPRLLMSILIFRPAIVICFHQRSYLNFTAYWAARLVGARFILEIVGVLHDPHIVDDVEDPEATQKKNPLLVTSFPMFLKNLFSKPGRSLWENYVFHMPVKNADALISITDDERAHVHRLFGRDSTRIYWCAPRARNVAETRPETDIPADFMLFIGRPKRRKGWDTAIDAIAILKDRGAAKHLVIVNPEKRIADQEAYAEKRGVRSLVTFLTSISNEEKQWVFAHATYVLAPSRYEGFGLPVFEALSSGKPVCATTIPVFGEFLEHRKNAMLSTPSDGEGLARSILELDKDASLRASLIKNGSQTLEKFNSEDMVDSYITLFDSLSSSEHRK